MGAVLVLGGCAGAGGPATSAEIAHWSAPAGVAADLVYVTDVDGFDLMTQAVGVWGDEGFSAVYVDGEGPASLMIGTSREPIPGAVPCAELPDAELPDAEPTLACAVQVGDVHVQVSGENVDAATLRVAADAVRVPREDELEHLFADTAMRPPVERGDLPPEGDGAPIDEVGPGG
ncbi:hypothetical protein N867_04760 [Actinotalea fermentans ATCC 43279 = JCM 9966 = DSM 3133]|nr:hypothetical protein N867_04760 [Actinotalea fermentans ATCC 43279 = JCM 9966 = DSM 3133]